MPSSFSYSSTNESFLTGGVESFCADVIPYVSMGMQSDASPAPAPPAPSETVAPPPPSQNPPAVILFDPYGNKVPLSSALNPSNALESRLPGTNPAANPSLSPQSFNLFRESSYTGSNLKVMLEIANDDGAKPIRFAKQLVELTTITVSVHRVKSPVPAMGYIKPGPLLEIPYSPPSEFATDIAISHPM